MNIIISVEGKEIVLSLRDAIRLKYQIGELIREAVDPIRDEDKL